MLSCTQADVLLARFVAAQQNKHFYHIHSFVMIEAR